MKLRKKSKKLEKDNNLFKQTTRIFLIGFLTSEIVSLIFLGFIAKAHNETPIPFLDYKPKQSQEIQDENNEDEQSSNQTNIESRSSN